jgi:hypothetical protein
MRIEEHMKTADFEIARRIEKMSLPEVKEAVKAWMVKPKSKNPNALFRYNHLMLDIENAPSLASLIKTTCNIVLAGEGLSVNGSKWQKDHAKHLYS